MNDFESHEGEPQKNDLVFKNQGHYGYLLAGIKAVAQAKDSEELFGRYPKDIQEIFGGARVTEREEYDVYTISSEPGKELPKEVAISQEFLKKLFTAKDAEGEYFISKAQCLFFAASIEEIRNIASSFGDFLTLETLQPDQKQLVLEKILGISESFLSFTKAFSQIAPSARDRYVDARSKKEQNDWEKRFIEKYEGFRKRKILDQLLTKKPSSESQDPAISQIWSALSSAASDISGPLET